MTNPLDILFNGQRQKVLGWAILSKKPPL